MDYIKLALHVLLPILLPLLILSSCAKGTLKERLTSPLQLDAKKGLLSQKMFWLSIAIPAAYFISFGIICWTGHNVDISSNGLANFISISAMPLTVLSASVPLAVTVASFHSTQQTAEQIALTARKNNLESYYLHRNEFFLHFKRHDETEYLECFKGSFDVNPRLYNNFFTGSPEQGTPDINHAAFLDIKKELAEAEEQLDTTISAPFEGIQTAAQYLLGTCNTMYRIGMKLGIKEIYLDLADKSIDVPVCDDEIAEDEARIRKSLGCTTHEAVSTYRHIRDYFDLLCEFAAIEMHENKKEFNYLSRGYSEKFTGNNLNIERAILEEFPKLFAHAQIRNLKILNPQAPRNKSVSGNSLNLS